MIKHYKYLNLYLFSIKTEIIIKFYLFNLLGKFDDDKVTAITSEDIPKLEGGCDWHTGTHYKILKLFKV